MTMVYERRWGQHDTVYIYALVDPRTEMVHYIGAAVDPQARYGYHLRTVDTDEPRSEKAQWIQNVRDAGLQPWLRVLDSTTPDKAARLEHEHIARHAERGHPLTNHWWHSFTALGRFFYDPSGIPVTWHVDPLPTPAEYGQIQRERMMRRLSVQNPPQ